MMQFLKRVVLCSCLLSGIASLTWAEVPVEDIGTPSDDWSAPVSTASPITPQLPIAPAGNSQLELLAQVKQLQQQIQELRGQLEVQSHEIQVLQDQVRSQYQDLEQRISHPQIAPVTTVPTLSVSTMPPAKPAIIAPISSTSLPVAIATMKKPSGETIVPKLQMTDQSAYQAAYNFVKTKDAIHAIPALRAYLKLYPNGIYVSNAHYWLGEMLLLQGNAEQAIGEFNTFINDYPQHAKIPDAKLKLGFAYYARSEWAKAKLRLRQVQQEYPGTEIAQLATARLEQMKLQGK